MPCCGCQGLVTKSTSAVGCWQELEEIQQLREGRKEGGGWSEAGDTGSDSSTGGSGSGSSSSSAGEQDGAGGSEAGSKGEGKGGKGGKAGLSEEEKRKKEEGRQKREKLKVRPQPSLLICQLYLFACVKVRPQLPPWMLLLCSPSSPSSACFPDSVAGVP